MSQRASKGLALLCLMGLSINALSDSARVLFVSGMHGNSGKVDLIESAISDHPFSIEQKSAQSLGEAREAAAVFSQYDLVIFNAVSQRMTKRSFDVFAGAVAQASKQNGVRFLAINALEDAGLNQGLESQHADRLHVYFDNGGLDNLARMADYLAYAVLFPDGREIAEPIIFPEVGIYHPDYDKKIFADRADYLAWYAKQTENSQAPTVGIILQRALIETVQTDVIDLTIEKLEARGYQVLPFFFELSPRVSDYSALLQENGKTQVDLLLNFRSIHWASQRKAEFERFGVPVVQAISYFSGSAEEWEQDPQGISPGMTPFVLVLPETAGVIDPTIIAAQDAQLQRSSVIEYQHDYLLDRVEHYLALKTKPNAEKK